MFSKEYFIRVTQRFARWLGEKAEDQRQVMTWFATGCGTFFIGLTLVILAETRIEPSLQQEIMAFIGLAILAGGFLLAMFGYLCILYWRFWKHFK